MINLTESFKRGYEIFLKEQAETDFENAFNGLEESQRDAEESFNILKEYFSLYSRASKLSEATPPTGVSPEGPAATTAAAPKQNRVDQKQEENILSSLIGVLAKMSDTRTEGDIRRDSEYRPITGAVEVTKISQMGFPENIIFFIKSLVSWLINVVRKFISVFTNVVRRFFGLEEGQETVTARDLTLKLAKSKEIRSITSGFSYGDTKEPKPIQLMKLPVENIERVSRILGESAKIITINEAGLFGDEEAEPREKGYYLNIENEDDRKKAQKALGIQPQEKTFSMVEIDISRDLENLEQLIQHFFTLFDDAYGSNREHLFETDDLELLLKLFRDTMYNIEHGTLRTYAVDGKLTSANALDASALKNNLMRTHVNTEKLKEVYVQIQKKIQNTLLIIGHKQLIAGETMGLRFKYYSAATYETMIAIINAIDPRIKQVASMERQLTTLRRRFEDLTVQLGRMRTSLQGFGEVVYETSYSKKINDLFEGARYVTQTITLRLATLGLYLRQLRDVKEGIANLNEINSRNRGKKFFFF
jgi:hypothetical protein